MKTNATTTNNNTASREALFTLIAHAEVPSINTLVTRNSDHLDFHDVSVGAIRRMLERAYAAGRAAAGEGDFTETTVREARQRLFDVEDQDGTRVRFQICPPAAGRSA